MCKGDGTHTRSRGRLEARTNSGRMGVRQSADDSYPHKTEQANMTRHSWEGDKCKRCKMRRKETTATATRGRYAGVEKPLMVYYQGTTRVGDSRNAIPSCPGK